MLEHITIETVSPVSEDNNFAASGADCSITSTISPRKVQKIRRDSLSVGTTLTRINPEFGPIHCDIIIYFSIEHYIPGCPARLYGDPGDCYPAEPAEYDFRIDLIEFDGGEVDDAPGPLTPAEIETLTAWFKSDGNEAACEAADGRIEAWEFQ